MSSDVQIRIAGSDDAEAIAAILYEAFAPFENLYTPEAFAATALKPEAIRKRFEEDGAIWIALKNGETAGTVSVLFDEQRLYIRSMAVLPSAQGHGIARRFLETIENFAVENGIKELFLYTVPFLDGAIRLYEQSDFERGELETEGFFGTSWFEMIKKLGKRI